MHFFCKWGRKKGWVREYLDDKVATCLYPICKKDIFLGGMSDQNDGKSDGIKREICKCDLDFGMH